MNHEQNTEYCVEVKGITTDQWFDFGGFFGTLDMANLAKKKAEKRDPAGKFRVVRLTTTREVVE